MTDAKPATPAETPPLIDVALQRRRLVIMVAIDFVCLLIAMGALVGDMGFHIRWMMWAFLGALLAGFAAQGWLVAGLRQKG